MMDDYESVKRQVADLTRKYEQSAGAHKQLKQQLKEDYGYDTVVDAQNGYDDLVQDEIELASQWTEKLEAFKKKWKDHLDGVA